MRHGSLFSGIGGFDYASKLMGWENVFHFEWMEFPRKVLEYHFPKSDSHIDICKTDFKKYANKIDIITGGFPCQPFSLAGKRKGTDDERYLWGEMLRAIQEIKPKFVIAENVFGITNIDGGMVFEQVCLDLEAQGYEVQPFIIPAASKNAPHRRDRVWFVATNTGSKGRGTGSQCEYDNARERQICKNEQINGNEIWSESRNGGMHGVIANSKCLRRGEVQQEIQPKKPNGEGFECISSEPVTTYTDNVLRRMGDGKGKDRRDKQSLTVEPFGKPTDWEKFPTQSPVCGGDDGLPTELDGITFSKWRAESIKGYGNAIVPQVALELFKVIEKLDKEI